MERPDRLGAMFAVQRCEDIPDKTYVLAGETRKGAFEQPEVKKWLSFFARGRIVVLLRYGETKTALMGTADRVRKALKSQMVKVDA